MQRCTLPIASIISQRTRNNFYLVVPEDILPNIRAINLNIVADTTDNFEVAEVYLNTFRSTKNVTNTIEIYGFDCSRLDQLINLTLSFSVNIGNSLSNFPPLPSLSILDLTDVQGLEEMERYPHLVNGLKYAAFVLREDATWNAFLLSVIC